MAKRSKKKSKTKKRIKAKIKKSISLKNIKKNKDLMHLALTKQSRLSVMPIDSKSWKKINKMSNI